MPSSSHPVERFSFSTALFGMLVLTLGMGLGRFLYTPMLPVMMAEGAFSFSQLVDCQRQLCGVSGWQSAIFVWRISPAVAPTPISVGFCHGERVVDPRNGMVAAIYSGVIDSLLAGVASAGMLIFGSTLIMQHTRHPFVLAALFSGVGIGIALGNEYVLAGLHFAFSSQTLWQGAGALSGMMLIALTLLMPSKKHAIAPMPLAKTEQQIMNWWLLAILYGWRDLVISSSRLSCRSWRKMQAHHC